MLRDPKTRAILATFFLTLCGCGADSTTLTIIGTAVVGIARPIELFNERKDLGVGTTLLSKNPDVLLTSGETVSVLTVENDALRIRTTKGVEGWVARAAMCTFEEFERRKRENQVPDYVVCINGKHLDFVPRQLAQENGGEIVRPGAGLWSHPTMDGKRVELIESAYFIFPKVGQPAVGREVFGDSSVLFLKSQCEGVVFRLPFWKSSGE